MRVVSWNMAYWKPGGFNAVQNRQRQWSFLLALNADVMLLQECRPPDFEMFAPVWAQSEFAVVGSIPAGWTASSAVVARSSWTPMIVGEADSAWFAYLSGYVARAQLTHPSLGIVSVASVHAPAKKVDDVCLDEEGHRQIKRSGCQRAWHSDLVAEGLRSWVDSSFIVGGDWNTARLFDDNYPGRWPNAGKEFFEVVDRWGWRESMRKTHPAEIQTYLDKASAPYQLDHLFTDTQLHDALTRCDPINEPLTRELSDHTPVIADFEIES